MNKIDDKIRWENFLLTLIDKYPAMYAEYTKKHFANNDYNTKSSNSKRGDRGT